MTLFVQMYLTSGCTVASVLLWNDPSLSNGLHFLRLRLLLMLLMLMLLLLIMMMIMMIMTTTMVMIMMSMMMMTVMIMTMMMVMLMIMMMMRRRIVMMMMIMMMMTTKTVMLMLLQLSVRSSFRQIQTLDSSPSAEKERARAGRDGHWVVTSVHPAAHRPGPALPQLVSVPQPLPPGQRRLRGQAGWPAGQSAAGVAVPLLVCSWFCVLCFLFVIDSTSLRVYFPGSVWLGLCFSGFVFMTFPTWSVCSLFLFPWINPCVGLCSLALFP